MATLIAQDVIMTTDQGYENSERTDLVEVLTTHRSFLRQTVQGLSDEQATSSVSRSTAPRPWGDGKIVASERDRALDCRQTRVWFEHVPIVPPLERGRRMRRGALAD